MRNDIEHKIQAEAVKHARLRWPICRTNLFAIPNGGARDAVTGKRLKDEGVLPGVFDLFLAVYSVVELETSEGLFEDYYGLWIEVKSSRGRLSNPQIRFRSNMERQGYRTAVCYSTQEILDVIEDYLDG